MFVFLLFLWKILRKGFALFTNVEPEADSSV